MDVQKQQSLCTGGSADGLAALSRPARRCYRPGMDEIINALLVAGYWLGLGALLVWLNFLRLSPVALRRALLAAAAVIYSLVFGLLVSGW